MAGGEHGGFALRPAGDAELDLAAVGGPFQADLDEGAFGAAIRLAGAWSIVALGAEAGAGGRVVRATGETPSGAKGDGETIVPYLSLAPQATFALTSFMGLRASVGVEVALRRHRFAVNDAPVLDLGTARGVAAGSFVFAAP